MSVTSPIRVVSLFSGCGGLDIPFSDGIFELVMAYDNDPAAIKCLIHNLECPAKVMDVTSAEFESELESLNNIDVVLGGFPCQGFSKSGPKKKDDPRNNLYLAMLKTVSELQPKLFLAENVDGIVQNFKGEYLNSIVTDFKKIGYDVDYKILDAVNYDVPQHRRRVLFIGTRENCTHEFTWPEPSNYSSFRNGEFKLESSVSPAVQIQLNAPRTISDAIADLLEENSHVPDHVYPAFSPDDALIMHHIDEGQKLCNVRFSPTSVHTWEIPEVFGETTEKERAVLITIGKNRRKKIYGTIPNGNPLEPLIIQELCGFDVSRDELLSLESRGYLKSVAGKFDLKGAMFCSGLYKRPLFEHPAPTVLTVFHDPRYFVHPIIDRPFSIRECARLQSFPDTFEFLNSGISEKDAYRLIGNAVPPKLAGFIAVSIQNYITEVKRNEIRPDTPDTH